jgi:hypothetical protein
MSKRTGGWMGTGSLGLTTSSALGWTFVASALTACGADVDANVSTLAQALGSAGSANPGTPPAAPSGSGGSPAALPAPNVDARRSLAITDQPILVNFGLRRVLQQLITTSGVAGLTPTALFQQWWDTQNTNALASGPGPHCDDVVDASGKPLLNGYPYTCRATPAEGSQASCDPFAAGSGCSYSPVGLFMRFDLAPADGRHCGEYRVVYAKDSGRTADGAQNRNLMIFEAALPNPHATQGIRGCQKIVRAWADLSTEPDIDKRRIQLERFYFDGYQEFDPVVTYKNYGENALGAGQVRTNQFIQPNTPRVWSLREFKIQRPCTPACSLKFMPVTDKVNPFGPLFGSPANEPNAAAFQTEFLTQIPSLAVADPSTIAMNVSDTFNSGQSQAASAVTETNYPVNFGPPPSAFRDAIQGSLTALGSSLTPDDIVQRAQVNACAGCHRFSNNADLGNTVIWPQSTGFTHVSEKDAELETAGGVTRFHISDALVNLLLPHRKQVVENFLNNVPLPTMPPNKPIGGRWGD